MVQLNGVSQPGSTTFPSGPFYAAGNQSGSADFQTQLSAALNSTLQKFGIDPSKVNITIGAAPGSNAGPAAPATASNATASAASSLPTASSVTTPAPGEDPFATPSADKIHAFDDAYWAKQPAAVQALRTTSNPDDRDELANKLMAAGYSIDVPIMMWGWDAAKVTNLRQAFGYTWVPAAGQAPVEEAPGLGVVGSLHQYDPQNPPPGSIKV
jgi:hypothetical protein